MNGTPMPAPVPLRWRSLVDAMCAGTLTRDECHELDRLVRSDPAARMFYLAQLDLHAQLHWELRGRTLEPLVEQPLAQNARRPFVSAAWHPARWMLAASLLLAVLGGLALWSRGTRHGEPHAEVRARLTASSGARWLHPVIAVDSTDGLTGGPWDLLQGLAEITFKGGARLLLEGPARFEIAASNRAILHFGRAVTHVTDAKSEFVIDAPRTRLIDRGTEFGVTVSLHGDVDVQVYEGEVLAQWKDSAGHFASQQHLVAGEAMERVSGARSPHATPFRAARFVRTLPPSNTVAASGPLYNQSQFETVHVRRSPADVVIDGDLADWNRGGAFRSQCAAPYGESYFVEGLMMYDADAVYVGAHVGDPYPMLNRRDPEADPLYVWAGGSVIVRLSTSSGLTWPLDARAAQLRTPELPDVGNRPQDLTDRLVNLVLWYHAPSARPQLQLIFGIGQHERLPAGDGWQGAFVRDADGLGYTVEYRIPWRILRAPDPPQPGDRLAATWNVHWSDAEGLVSRGFLAEITNPGAGPFLFLNSSTWGRAI